MGRDFYYRIVDRETGEKVRSGNFNDVSRRNNFIDEGIFTYDELILKIKSLTYAYENEEANLHHYISEAIATYARVHKEMEQKDNAKLLIRKFKIFVLYKYLIDNR
jgi:hypothetical protein